MAAARIRFRTSTIGSLAGLVALFGTIPIASLHWYFAPLVLVPLAVVVWGWRSGTSVDPAGVSVRALLGRRRLPWSQITGFVHAGNRVIALLANGGSIALPGVTPDDLPRVMAAGGQELTDTPEPATPEPTAPEPATVRPAEAAAVEDDVAERDEDAEADQPVSNRPGPR